MISFFRSSPFFSSTGRGALVAALILGFVLGTTPAAAQGAFPDAAMGYDVSYPQCNADLSATVAASAAGNQFAIVGVTRGRAFTDNPCLPDEYQILLPTGFLPFH